MKLILITILLVSSSAFAQGLGGTYLPSNAICENPGAFSSSGNGPALLWEQVNAYYPEEVPNSASLSASLFKLGFRSGYAYGSSAGATRLPEQLWRGNTNSRGGFDFWTRFVVGSGGEHRRLFVGLINDPNIYVNWAFPCDATPATNPSARANTIYFGADDGDTTMHVGVNDGVSVIAWKDSFEGVFPVTDDAVYEVRFSTAANSDSVEYVIKWLDQDPIVERSGSLIAQLPAKTVFLAPALFTCTADTTPAELYLVKACIATQY